MTYLQAAVDWLLSKLFPYRLPSRLGTMLAAQHIITDRARTGLDP